MKCCHFCGLTCKDFRHGCGDFPVIHRLQIRVVSTCCIRVDKHKSFRLNALLARKNCQQIEVNPSLAKNSEMNSMIRDAFDEMRVFMASNERRRERSVQYSPRSGAKMDQLKMESKQKHFSQPDLVKATLWQILRVRLPYLPHLDH